MDYTMPIEIQEELIRNYESSMERIYDKGEL